MTTRQRLDLLARAYPRLFPRAELLRLLRSELGHVDALDTWTPRDGVRVRARAPKIIYHICAGNLAISAWTSLAYGLLLGAHNVVKLPGDRDGSSARSEILAFIRGLPKPLRSLVETHRELDTDLIHSADAVIAFGSDAAMSSLRALTRWDQKFIAHGHALSLLWLADPNRLTPHQARACAIDILTYDQLGCLSPQAIYAESLLMPSRQIGGSCPKSPRARFPSRPGSPRHAMSRTRSVIAFGCRPKIISAGP
jgi:hypothetical protein